LTLVAHAASLALAGRADVLRVHIVASEQTRVSRLWLPNKLVSEEEYAKAIAESDHQRRQYLARFYDVDQESPTHYDLVINTDMLGIEQAVAAIATVATA
jgi:cytidylate kinase